MTAGIEDAGFEIRDTICWLYGSGFPKSLDVSKAIDRQAGAEREVVGPDPEAGRRNKATPRFNGIDYANGEEWQGAEAVPLTAPATPEAQQWQGWGTALKPAHEPIVVARKPLSGTVAQTVLEHGTGALNIDASRIDTDDNLNGGAYAENATTREDMWSSQRPGDENVMRRGREHAGEYVQPSGRWPANVVLGHHPDCGLCTSPECDCVVPCLAATGHQNVACHPECPIRLLDEQTGELGLRWGRASRFTALGGGNCPPMDSRLGLATRVALPGSF